jgi:tRNA-specific 2-thiouridylase
MDHARTLGAKWVATGHYARIRRNPESGGWELHRAVDASKDQSYVLHVLKQEQLSHSLLPLGEWTKLQVRDRARALGLRVADKADSQEICFVPDGNYGHFLEEVEPDAVRPGKVVDTAGKVRGEHRGVAFYTVGQRKGLGIASNVPMYVTRIDAGENLVVIGDDAETLSRGCLVSDLNWIGVPEPAVAIPVRARIRYNMHEAPARVEPMDDGRWRLTFDEPQRAVTPGQSAVFYRNDQVLGGGVIDCSAD